MWRVVVSSGPHAHVMPINDLRDHAAELDCWCRPERDLVDSWVIVHNSLDRRETYEQERKPT